MIEFLCPNGHRIHCPEEQAGRAAKCPRCGVKFRVPETPAAGSEDAADSESGASRPELTDSGVSEAPPEGGVRPASREPQIEFLCPNGHRLHGSASLQGRPGECPECGSRFRIPIYDDVSEEEGMELEIGVGRADGGGESGLDLAEVEVEEVGEPREQEQAEEAAEIEERAEGHPLAGLFSKLWAERPPGAAVELHLAGGETLLPDRFAKALSQRDHGVFAVQEPGGAHTLTVVAWDSIVRVLVRGVEQLPEEMCE